MAATVMKTGEKPAASTVVDPTVAIPNNNPKYYRGFVAGVFSGIAKLSGECLPTSQSPPSIPSYL
jgi:hypothetical protein